jgi:hypothetical protein
MTPKSKPLFFEIHRRTIMPMKAIHLMALMICALALVLFLCVGCAQDKNLPNAGDTSDSQCDVFVDEY